jgi:hypothetical protein
MSKSAQQRAALFDRGATAVSLLLSELKDLYACPLCGQLFDDPMSPDLTLEHVPPRQLGGRRITLTCRDCNSTSGHNLDAQMQTLEEWFEFAAGQTRRPLRTRLKFGDALVNVDVEHQADGFKFLGLPKLNHPASQQAWVDELNRLVDSDLFDGYRFGVEFVRKLRPRRAYVGWLRAAYLAAFAALGYSYAFRPALSKIRRQIASPDEVLISTFSVTTANVPPANSMSLVTAPKHLRSILVQMGRHVVFLPALDGSTPYEQFDKSVAAAQPFGSEMEGESIPWPAGMRLALDFARQLS